MKLTNQNMGDISFHGRLVIGKVKVRTTKNLCKIFYCAYNRFSIKVNRWKWEFLYFTLLNKLYCLCMPLLSHKMNEMQ